MGLPNVGSALYAQLAAGSALMAEAGGSAHLYESVVLGGSAHGYPHIVYARASGGDDNSSPRRTRTEDWLVKGVALDEAQARRLDALIDGQLHGVSLTIAGWDNYQTTRRRDVAYAEPGESGVVYWHRGGVYRLQVGES